MPYYSQSSKEKLETCDSKIQQLFNEVIKHRDCSIIYGHRTPEEQWELFKKGRKLVGGVWIIVNPSEVVTYKDGWDKKSNHNEEPSKAVDAAPFPIDWDDEKRFYHFAGFVMGVASQMGIKLIWGGDWKMQDLVHYELA